MSTTTRQLRKLSRRFRFLALRLLVRVSRGHPRRRRDPRRVNDVHSQLNKTRVARVVKPASLGALQATIKHARRHGPLAISGGRHAMGGQQFAAGSLLLETTELDRVLQLDRRRRLIEVEAGIKWPKLIAHTIRAQRRGMRPFGIRQKQTGADRMSIGGAIAANVHGRGLTLRPFVSDVESFVLVDARGRRRLCSRTKHPELFRLVIGGYGLFGVVARATLRLAPRRKVERVVELVEVDDLQKRFEERIAAGFLFGDFQFAIARQSEEFMQRGVFSCYRPVSRRTPISATQRELSPSDWKELLYLAHAEPRRAFELYAGHYLATSGQIYWSDTHQLTTYIDNYHREVDARMCAPEPGSEMIAELFGPRDALARFISTVREDFRKNSTEPIYGTIRLVERDDETFLAWARESFACVVFNLHVQHTRAGLARARKDFRLLIDRAISFAGSFYLTYHRWATREQILACYPQMPEFLRLKRAHDPAEVFQSDWYRQYRGLFADWL